MSVIQYQSEPIAEVSTTSRPQTPTGLKHPAFLMNFPFSHTAAIANNPWMEDVDPAEREPDFLRATRQFLELYRFIAAESLVFLLPTPSNCTLQDLAFTANLGVVLEHMEDTVVISKFTSEPRIGEESVGQTFFNSMGYQTHMALSKFEGEAELKHLHDNVYVGSYGLRSQRETYEWMESTFDMKVIPLQLTDPYLYHLDCSIFPVTREATLVCTELYERDEIAALERETNIIDVSIDDAYAGICNSVRLSNVILNASNLPDLQAGTEIYTMEVQKNRRLEDIACELAFEVSYFNLSEFMKSGALLSCMLMHLNRYSYEFTLI